MWQHEKRPSVRIKRVLSGEVRMEDEEPGIQSACSYHIFHGAKAVLSKPTKDERRKALEKIPALIRPHVEKEATRIYKSSRGKS